MNFSISDLEHLTGISTHTIRIWERRYNALTPIRSEGNTRLYDDNQLRRLLNIVSLVQSGLKISKACSLNDQEIDKLLGWEIEKTVSDDLQFEYYVNQLLNFGIEYNEKGIDSLLTHCINKYSVPETYKHIIYPLLVRLGLMWQKDNYCPSQEHFLTSIIKQKLFAAIDKLPLPQNSKNNWLLFLPEDEDHDIGLIFANYLLRLSGQKVTYLGPRVPLISVKNVIIKSNITNILLFMVKGRSLNEIKDYLTELSKIFNKSKIQLAGNTKLLNELDMHENVNLFRSLDEFEHIIKSVNNAE